MPPVMAMIARMQQDDILFVNSPLNRDKSDNENFNIT